MSWHNECSLWSSCAGHPPPVVEWVRVDGPMPPTTQVRDKLLIIPRVTESDAGTYRCMASSIAGFVYAQVVIKVQGRMTIHPFPTRDQLY